MSIPSEPSSLLNESTSAESFYALGVFAAGQLCSTAEATVQLSGKARHILRLFASEPGVSVHELLDRKQLKFETNFCEAALPQVERILRALVEKNFEQIPLSSLCVFVRGVFDCLGQISSVKSGNLEVRILRSSEAMTQALLSFFETEADEESSSLLVWRSVKAFDLIGQLYGDLGSKSLGQGEPSNELKKSRGQHLYRPKNLRRFFDWANCVAGFEQFLPGEIRVQRLSHDARLPEKQRVSDSGYDLTILNEKKRFGSTILYGTGLIVEAPQGWYFDVVPRSSIIKKGYILANNVGIIDRAYRGELMIPLLKVDPDAPKLELPLRIAQLIPRPIVHMSLKEVDVLTETARGVSGFGSSGT